MSQPHCHLIEVQHTDAQINCHTKVLSLPGDSNFSSDRQTDRLRRNLAQRCPDSTGHSPFSHMIGRDQSLALRRHDGPFNYFFYRRNKFTAKIDGD